MPQDDAVQDDLAAGQEMNALVTEKVFRTCSHPDDRVRIIGRPGDRWKHCDKCGQEVNGIPSDYSSDISAAWLVLEHMGSLGWKVQVQSNSQLEGYEVDEPWVCVFASRDGASWAAADTAPLAICRAALAAVSEHP